MKQAAASDMSNMNAYQNLNSNFGQVYDIIGQQDRME